MKKAAYILFGLQIFGLFGSIVGGEFTELLANMLFLNGVYGFSSFLGYFMMTWIGIFLLVKAKKKEAKTNMVFLCPNCKRVYEGTSGEANGCPNCRVSIVETDILYADWKKMTEEEKRSHIYRWS